MTLQHSPGPWTTDFFGRLIYDSQNAAICEIWDDQKRPENSRLIAAAPDMLRLLRMLVPMSESGAEDREGWMVWNAALNEASELIARLDGEA